MRPDTGHDTKPDIRIDKEGVWYYCGTVYQHLKRDPDGRYHIEIGEDRADVDVEDTPYVVKSVSCISMDGKGKDVINLHMPDDTIIELDPSTLRVGADNTLYGIMARVGIEARFSRSSYYQLAEHIEFEAGLDKFYISLNGHRYYIR
jgi:hypothetical protein